MKHATLTSLARTAIIATTAAAFALGAANAYAADAENVIVVDDGTARAWTYHKTALGEGALTDLTVPSVIRSDEPLPDMIAPITVSVDIDANTVDSLSLSDRSRTEMDLRNFNLIDDDTVFVGSQGRSQFDTRDAYRNRAAIPNNLNAEPFVPVAGAGLATNF